MSDGASLTLGDGTETIAINSSLTDLSALGAFTGVLSVTLTNGASLVATDADTLTITETTIDLVGATVVDGLTASGDIAANGNIKGDGVTDIDTMETITCDNLVVSNTATISNLTAVAGGVFNTGADSIGATEIDSGTEVATISAAAASLTSYAGGLQTSLITFTNTVHIALDGGDRGEEVEIITFPKGRILIVGAAIDATTTVNSNFEAHVNDEYFLGIGTAVAGADATLAGTEQDIIATTTIDTDSGNDLVTAWEADFTSGGDTVFDGTASAVKLYATMAIADTSILAGQSITNTLTGTLRVHWIFLGDD